MNFRFDIFNLCDECYWDFDRNCILTAFGSIAIFSMLILGEDLGEKEPSYTAGGNVS
jgi:hypothetical protein